MPKIYSFLKANLVKNRLDLISILILAVLTTAFHWRIVYLQQIMVAADWLYTTEPWKSETLSNLTSPIWNLETTDSILQFYPVATYAKEAREHREFFWDPYPFAGMPSMARGESFSNPLFIFLSTFLSVGNALSWMGVLNLFLAGSFMFLLLREIGAKQFGSLIGSLAFALNGYLIGWLTNYQSSGSMIWLPLIFLGVERALHKQNWRWLLITALAFTLQILSGFIMWPVYGAITLILFTIYRSITNWLDDKNLIKNAQPLLYGLIALGLGTLLAAYQLFITIQLYLHTPRIESLGSKIFYPLKSQIVRLIAPTIFGVPTHGNFYWGPSTYTETNLYFGILPLLFLLVIPLISKRRIALGFFLIGLVSYLAVDNIPPFRQFIAFVYPVFLKTSPMRIFHVVSFTWACAAGLAADWLVNKKHKRLFRYLSLVAILLAGVLATFIIFANFQGEEHSATIINNIASKLPLINQQGLFIHLGILLVSSGLLWIWSLNIKTEYLKSLTLAVLVIDLFYVSMNYNPAFDPKFIFPETDSVRFLSAELDNSIPPDRVLSVYTNHILTDMTPQVYGFPTPTGYSSWVLQRYSDYMTLTQSRAPTLVTQVYITDCCNQLIDALNVKYVFTPFDIYPTSSGIYDLYTHLDQASKDLENNILVNKTNWILQDQKKPVLLEHPPARLKYRLDITRPATLKTAIAIDPAVWDKPGDGVQFEIHLTIDNREKLVFKHYIDPKNNPHDRQVIPIEVDLSQYIGEEIYITLETKPGPNDDPYYDWAGWIQPRIENYRESTLVLIHDGPNRVYENIEAFPRAWIVHRAIHVAKDNLKAVRKYLRDPKFDLATMAVIEQGASSNQLVKYAPKKSYPQDRVNITEYSAEYVKIETELVEPGVLVLADVMYPGWKVYVDGIKVPILTTNLIMRGVPLEEGKHQVEFIYKPDLYFLGLVVAGVTLLLVIAVLILLPRKKKMK